jgi:hypothetical protein
MYVKKAVMLLILPMGESSSSEGNCNASNSCLQILQFFTAKFLSETDGWMDGCGY